MDACCFRHLQGTVRFWPAASARYLYYSPYSSGRRALSSASLPQVAPATACQPPRLLPSTSREQRETHQLTAQAAAMVSADTPAQAQNGHHAAEAAGGSKPLNKVLTSRPTTVFTVMSSLAAKHQSVNLGQGFPDEEGPEEMKRVAGEALLTHHNQYPPSVGLREARQALARYAERHSGLATDWQTEVLITNGASEALAAALLGLLNPGDEVVLFDPQYDLYAPMVARAGAVPVTVKLDPSQDWALPRADLAAAFSPRTKLLVLNTPHNPTGKVFSREELEAIAALCRQWDVYAVLDEVYEHLVFEGSRHVSLRTLPGMRERSVQIGSAGKTFSFTAWKIGWAVGPARLIAALASAHQYLVFTVASSLQRAVAYGLDEQQGFYLSLGRSLQERKEYVSRRLGDIGFRVLPCAGTYFVIADFTPLRRSGSSESDVDFCTRLTTEAGVTLIPVSALYASPDPPQTLVRVCFCKAHAKLEAACDKLEQYFQPHRNGGAQLGG